MKIQVLLISVLLVAVAVIAESPPKSTPFYPVLAPMRKDSIKTFPYDQYHEIHMDKPAWQKEWPSILNVNTPLGMEVSNNPDLAKIFGGTHMSLLSHFNCPKMPPSCVTFKFDGLVSDLCVFVGSVDAGDHVTLNGSTNGLPYPMNDWKLVSQGSFSATIPAAHDIKNTYTPNKINFGCPSEPTNENPNYQLWKPPGDVDSLTFCYQSFNFESTNVFYAFVKCGNDPDPSISPIRDTIAIAGYAFKDQRGDGLRWPGITPAIPGVEVSVSDALGNSLRYANGAVAKPVMTDANGYYVFDGFLKGIYKVTFKFPDGTIYSKQTTGQGVPNASKVNNKGVTNTLTVTATAPGSRLVLPSDNVPNSKFILPDINAGIAVPHDLYIDGVIFTDYNNNGIMDVIDDSLSAIDTPRPAISVQLIDSGGTVVKTLFTGPKGSFNFTGLTPGDRYTIRPILPPGTQMSKVPTTPIPEKAISVTPAGPYTPVAHVNFGIISNEKYCQTNPSAVLVCYVRRDSNGPNADESVIISFPLNSRPHLYDPIQGNIVNHLASHRQVGAVYGLGVHRMTGNIYTSAFMKYASGFGPAGTGAIYRIPKTTTGYGVPSLFFDINKKKGKDYAGVNPHSVPIGDADISTSTVGAISYGDLDIDGDMIYTIVLASKELLTISAKDSSQFTLRKIFNPCQIQADWRPFALGIKDHIVYIGGVCSQETSPNKTAIPVGYIIRDNSVLLKVPLDFPRACKHSGDGFCISGNYSKWSDVFYDNQPMISDITFDGDSAFVISIRDRGGDLDVDIGTYDMLRVCRGATADSWVIEKKGVCGGVTGAHPKPSGYFGKPDGPDGGEFYDDSFFYMANGIGHDNVASTAAFILPGYPTIVGSSLDIDNVGQGAVKMWRNSNGTFARGFGVYLYDDIPTQSFGKANGLGDIEPICEMLKP
eukprot:gene17201-20500_t